MLKIINLADIFFYSKLKRFSKNKFLFIVNYSGSIIFICIIILLLLVFKVTRNYGFISGVSIFINSIIVLFLKNVISRKRGNSNDFLEKYDPYSFPSGHVSSLSTITGSLFFFFPLSLIFFILSILVSIYRIGKGYHYFSDCAGGFIIGLICGFAGMGFSFLYLDLANYLFKFIFG